MGYTHYWYRQKTISPVVFARILKDFKAVMPILDYLGVSLAGPSGEDGAVISKNNIRFNGVHSCGHNKRDLGITWPSSQAQSVKGAQPNDINQNVEYKHWFAGAVLEQRECDGDCSHESFIFDRIIDKPTLDAVKEEGIRKGLYFDCTKTAFKPYDIAVQLLLLIAKHHMKDKIVINSDGNKPQWIEASQICERVLKYKNPLFHWDRDNGSDR